MWKMRREGFAKLMRMWERKETIEKMRKRENWEQNSIMKKQTTKYININVEKQTKTKQN